MAEKSGTQSQRDQIFESAERARAEQVNAELEEMGSPQRVEYTPGPEETISDFLGEDKSVAADKRLEEASFANRQAQQVLADARAEAERIREAAAAAAKNPNAGGDAGRDDKAGSPSGKDAIESAVSLIYEGAQDEAAGILDAEINRRVEEARAASVTDFSWDQELNAFKRDHADIAQDPELAIVFQRHLNDEWAKNPTTPREAIDRATVAVNAWLDDKLSARFGSARSGRSRSRAAQEEEYDASAVVAEMKRARGQT